MPHPESWAWRKNLAPVGERCSHGFWWSQDCQLCAFSESGQELTSLIEKLGRYEVWVNDE